METRTNPSLRLAFAEELHDLAALLFAGHDLDERDAVPGKDDARHAVRDIAQGLAVARARVEEDDIGDVGRRQILHVGDERVFVGEVDDDVAHKSSFYPVASA